MNPTLHNRNNHPIFPRRVMGASRQRRGARGVGVASLPGVEYEVDMLFANLSLGLLEMSRLSPAHSPATLQRPATLGQKWLARGTDRLDASFQLTGATGRRVATLHSTEHLQLCFVWIIPIQHLTTLTTLSRPVITSLPNMATGDACK